MIRCRPSQCIEVVRCEGREHLRITFPKLDGYRVELPDEDIWLDLDDAPVFEIGPNTVPTLGRDAAASSASRSSRRATRRSIGRQEVAFALAKRILDAQFNTGDDKRPWLFPKLVRICQDWIEQKRRQSPSGYNLGHLMTITEAQVLAAEKIWNAITRQAGNRRERLRPMINRFDPEGSTGDVDFLTRKRTVPTEKSEVSHVTLDGKDGNTWEQLLAAELELNRNVAVLREERPPRLHDPVCAQGPQPLLRPGLPGPAQAAPRTRTSTAR